jgi:hypothetical protein
MPKPNVYREFMKALKRHWKTVLPNVKPLTEPHGSLPMASTFYVGRAKESVHVFLHFQTHSNFGGLFTINVILETEDSDPCPVRFQDRAKLIDDFLQGPNRIGRFLQTRRGDKWWQLCRDEGKEILGQKLGQSLFNKDWWYPKDYEDIPAVVQDAVADVTFSVHITLTQLGLPGACNASTPKNTALEADL